MYVKRVVLSDIKGFQELDFTFSRPDGSYRGWTVVTGDNATGKSALLKSIAMAIVGPEVMRALQPSLRGWIRGQQESGAISVELRPEEEDKFTTGRRYESTFWSELELSRTKTAEIRTSPGDSRRGKKKGPLNGPWAEGTSGWFAAGYGPFRRLYGASPEAQRLMSGPSRVARFATMFKEDATLGECDLWLRDLAHKKLEGRGPETQLLLSLLALLNDEFLRNSVEVQRVDSDGLWLRDSSGTTLHLEDMSEGYRAALAMMMDIVRHFAEAHGPQDLFRRDDDGHLVLRHPGVVLIDEIDAHLHPEWQRQIGFWLKKRFPHVQFIVTTHSALICQAADPGGIFHLGAPGTDQAYQLTEMDYWRVVRAKPNEILLSPAFNLEHTRSPLAQEQRAKYAALKAKQRGGGRLTSDEKKAWSQAELFVEEDERASGT